MVMVIWYDVVWYGMVWHKHEIQLKQQNEHTTKCCSYRIVSYYQCLYKQRQINIHPENKLIGILTFRSPNQGLDCSFCCWVAGQGLAEKE